MKVVVKGVIVLLLLVQFGLQTNAQNVSDDLAKNIATKFLAAKKGINQNELVVANVSTTYSSKGEALLYIFNFEGGGFVIVAADKRTEPVLAYSKTNSFVKGEVAAAEEWVDAYAGEISAVKEAKAVQTAAMTNKWNNAEKGFFPTMTQKAVVVEPLLTSAWNQDKYYNGLCPDDAAAPSGYDNRVPNGCVALAMAQIMYYHRYPRVGKGAMSYSCPPYGTLKADFAKANYNYDAMSYQASGYSNAIALLCFHAGVSVKMGYGPEGSGTQSNLVPNAMYNRFNYKLGNYQDRSNYASTAAWGNLIKTDLLKGLPVYYSACRRDVAGDRDNCHAFICDGFDDADYFHFDFGWGGNSNGFYTLDSICAIGANIDRPYSLRNAIITGLEPQTEVAKSTGTDTLTAIYGSFSDGSSPRKNYENNTNRAWLISPQNGRNVTEIKLKTSYFSTEENNDIVSIYSGNTADLGNLLFTWSGYKDTTIRILASEAFVTFTSDGSGVDKGFLFTYTTQINGSNYCKTSHPSLGSADIFKDSVGIISSGSGAGKYDDDNICYWALAPAGANVSQRIGIKFSKFDLAEGDFLELHKWSSTAGFPSVKYPTHGTNRFSKENPPKFDTIYEVREKGAFIVFRTDNNLNGKGFEFEWRTIEVGVAVPEASAGIENISVYPNPATDVVGIQIETLEPEKVQLTLYDVFGRAVSKISNLEAAQQISQNIDVSHFAKGIYMLRITTSKGQIMRKVVIQ